MNIKTATLVALIGNSTATLYWLARNLSIFDYSSGVSILMNILGGGSLVLFLFILYKNQN